MIRTRIWCLTVGICPGTFTACEHCPGIIDKLACRVDVKNIFDPLINDILRLIDEQVKSALLKRDGRGIKVGADMIPAGRQAHLTGE